MCVRESSKRAKAITKTECDVVPVHLEPPNPHLRRPRPPASSRRSTFPRGKGNRIESNAFPRGKGNNREPWIRLFPFTFLTGTKSRIFVFLNTGCRAQPCRRKRETHRGFHIQSVPFTHIPTSGVGGRPLKLMA